MIILSIYILLAFLFSAHAVLQKEEEYDILDAILIIGFISPVVIEQIILISKAVIELL